MGNREFRAIKASTPGPYTFILPATREAPKAMLHPKKKTVGVRVPDHVTARALLDLLGVPLQSSTLILPGSDEPMTDGWTIADTLAHEVDAVLDSGDVGTARDHHRRPERRRDRDPAVRSRGPVSLRGMTKRIDE
jgi:tRNA A37 threonylcarbamoyladenosine synthetase subunit TsaC/SUA5/YrdC